MDAVKEPEELDGEHGMATVASENAKGTHFKRYILLTIAAFVAVVILAYTRLTLYWMELRKIYLSRSSSAITRPDAAGFLRYEEVFMKAADGVRLQAYWIPDDDAEWTVLYFHVPQCPTMLREAMETLARTCHSFVISSKLVCGPTFCFFRTEGKQQRKCCVGTR